jgi:hypothetical protein
VVDALVRIISMRPAPPVAIAATRGETVPAFSQT